MSDGFLSGVTELPRELMGGAAIALGADRQSTNDFLGLDPQAESQGLVDKIKNNPAKFIGEIVPYVFLPTRLFAKGMGERIAAQAKRTGRPIHKIKRAIDQSAHLGLAMGTYGAVDELARAQVDGRESDASGRFVSDAMFAVGFGAAAKTALIGASKIKDKVMKNKYVKDALLDSGLPPQLAAGFANASEADKVVMMNNINNSSTQLEKALAATLKDTIPVEKIKEGKPSSILKDYFGQLDSNISSNIEKTAEKPQKARKAKLPKKGKHNIAEEARKPIADLRASADDMESHVNNIERRANNIKVALLEAYPKLEDRQKISMALDIDGEHTYRLLRDDMKQTVDILRESLDNIGHALEKEGVIKGFRKEYLPHLINKVGSDNTSSLQEMLDSVSKRSHVSASTARGKGREFDDKPLHKRENALTTDIAEIIQLYGIQVGHASAMKHVINSLDSTMLSHKPIHGWKKINYGAISKEMRQRGIGDIKDKKGFVKQQDVWYVHPDYKPSLDMLFQRKDMNNAMKALVFANFASKRILILGSLFHFSALSESALFAGAGGIGAAAKGAGAGFLLTGGNPLGAAVGAGIGVGAKVLVNTKNIAAQLRGGEYGDMYDFAARYIDLKPPRDVGTDEFYNGLSDIQGLIDKYVPTNTAKGLLKKGTRAVGGINKAIDVLMWHRLMSGAKIVTFQCNLERLIEKNNTLPEAQRRTQDELAKLAGQFTNDAFGGQNWRRLAEGVDNAFGRRIAAAMATPNGQKWANLIMFAPDWTISNLRIIGKAFPGINKDRMSRMMYQRYATRAAIYYMLVGTAMQMALTGKPIWENEDPTKLDLGDGRTMTFSKQLMEPFHWLSSPTHEAVVKQSSVLKLGEELATNQQFIGGYSDRIWHDDESPLEKTGDTLKVAGKHYAPIFVQDINKNGMDGIYGFFGHPIYGSIRHGFKNSDGTIEEN